MYASKQLWSFQSEASVFAPDLPFTVATVAAVSSFTSGFSSLTVAVVDVDSDEEEDEDLDRWIWGLTRE